MQEHPLRGVAFVVADDELHNINLKDLAQLLDLVQLRIRKTEIVEESIAKRFAAAV